MAITDKSASKGIIEILKSDFQPVSERTGFDPSQYQPGALFIRLSKSVETDELLKTIDRHTNDNSGAIVNETGNAKILIIPQESLQEIRKNLGIAVSSTKQPPRN